MLRLTFQEENGARTELTWDQAHNENIEDVARFIRENLGEPSMKRTSHNGWAPLEKVD